jgi:hypothetical protein
MKQPLKHLISGLTLIGAAAAWNADATLLTFDSLSTGFSPPPTYATIPNGYGGLHWNNFDVINGETMDASDGYHSGVVSPNNVAFNAYGDPATISVATGVFALNSGYLTAALNLNTPVQIEVQGFFGATMLYDNFYSVYNTGPTLFNFDYVGVNEVTFISSPAQQFALDNLDVTVPDQPRTMILLGITFLGLGFLPKASCRR